MKQLFFWVVLLILPTVSNAQHTAEFKQKHYNISKTNLAVSGWDVVSYFSNTPLKGNASFAVVSNGVYYRFANQENKNLFLANPVKYEPAYGGWCAFAMGDKGEKVTIDPKYYKIIEGKLFLFYYDIFNNTLKKWNGNEKTLHKNADINWLKLTK